MAEKENPLQFLEKYAKVVHSHLAAQIDKEFGGQPSGLYSPCKYILELKAKRIRPILVLLANELFCDEFTTETIHAALGLEIFHNMTLIHDDIMDESPLRRGCQTVHTKWNVNTAILSGDVMLIKAFQAFEGLEAGLMKQCLCLFSVTMVQLCEGQQLDVDFETQQDVTEAEYFTMIRLKTSVLIACALKLGAILGGASEEDAQNIYQFGEKLGLAFQIQDDVLDLWGTAKVGKRLGGDIFENKKTILYIKALELADTEQRAELLKHYATTSQEQSKMDSVQKLFEQLGVKKYAQQRMGELKAEALTYLSRVNTAKPKDVLQQVADFLIKRNV